MSQGKGFIATETTKQILKEFEIHCEIAKDEPILIIGPSGVGKSWFLQKFKNLEEDNKRSEPLYIDCSMFIGEDANIARSALFGHVKGAFTGAINTKPGLIEEAAKNEKALILDEIGELPPNVQSMILIFIETGKYRRVGETDEREKKVRVVAATNREESLRDELRYRFFKFYIPGLHERREDILPLFASYFPGLFKKLQYYEIEALLAYHWPGNVRELKQVGMMMECSLRTDTIFPEGSVAGAMLVKNKKATGFDLRHSLDFSQRIEKAGIDKPGVRMLLQDYKLELDATYKPEKSIQINDVLSNWQPFNFEEDVWVNIDKDEYSMELNHNLAIKITFRIWKTYCQLLSLNLNANKDLMRQKKWKYNKYTVFNGRISLSRTLRAKSKKYLNGLKEYLRSPKKQPDLTKYSYEELMITYHKQLLAKTKTKTEAANLAKVKPTTFNNRLNKYNIKK